MHAFYTIGHSTRTVQEFLQLLQSVEVTLVVDVQTIPRSRTNPQYDRGALPDTLREVQIGYEHIASLGGLRGAKREVPPSVNGFWENKSFITMLITPWGMLFARASRGLSSLVVSIDVPSCAPKPCGGVVTDASSQITC